MTKARQRRHAYWLLAAAVCVIAMFTIVCMRTSRSILAHECLQ